MAIPLILSAGSWTVQMFVDRMFLCWYHPQAMGASLAAGSLQFAAVSFFLGTASYANTFVAQYHGAERHDRVGPSVWQSIYFSILAFVLLACLIPFAPFFFNLAGHGPTLRRMETDYFRVLCLGSGFNIYAAAISGFYSGRGKTWPILWVNALSTIVNVVLDYVLIFGHWGMPALGVTGAALATNAAFLFNAIAFSIMFFSKGNRNEYNTVRGWHFEGDLFKRLLRYGMPSGFHFMSDILVFTLFIQLVGRIGPHELTATTLAFNINMLAFLPMIGFGIATSSLVGQRLGSNEPDLAEKSARSVFHMTFVYMVSVGVLFVLFPDFFMSPFAAKANPLEFEQVRPIARLLLRFVAFYCIFDTLNIIFASALKGAGDTKYVMWMTLGLGLTVMVAPTVWATGLKHGAIYAAWTALTAYVCILGLSFLIRFAKGKWKLMRVIEPTVLSEPAVPGEPTVPGVPLTQMPKKQE